MPENGVSTLDEISDNFLHLISKTTPKKGEGSPLWEKDTSIKL